MVRKSLVMMLLLNIFGLAGVSRAEGKFSGYVFADYYYLVADHNDSLMGRNGFWIRRIYLTHDREFEDKSTSPF